MTFDPRPPTHTHSPLLTLLSVADRASDSTATFSRLVPITSSSLLPVGASGRGGGGVGRREKERWRLQQAERGKKRSKK